MYAQTSCVFAAPDRERAKRLQDKMVNNLTMAKDRLALLGRCCFGCLTCCRLDHVNIDHVNVTQAENQYCPCFTEATLASKRRLNPQPKPVARSHTTVPGNIRPSTAVRPPPRPADPKVCPTFTLVSSTDELCTHMEMFFVSVKVTPRSARAQNGKPAAGKQPPKRDMKNFKNVDSKLANLIMNEIIDTYVEALPLQLLLLFLSLMFD